MTDPLSFKLFATTAKGMETLLAEELKGLGALHVRNVTAGVAFQGHLEMAYRACLWSRVASRVLLQLTRFHAQSPNQLYAGVRSQAWGQHVAPEGTIAVDFTGTTSSIAHTRFGAQKTKDAIVDRIREDFGVRPSVDLRRPDLRINVRLHRETATVSIDLSGTSLHRRGYRERGLKAPLKENLAAAILLLADWPNLARRGLPLLDPMCGSGTLPLEAALMAGDIAPGLSREDWGFRGWLGHDERLWAAMLEEARERRNQGWTHIPPVFAFDADPRAVETARANVEKAGLDAFIRVERRDLLKASLPASLHRPGLLVVNPPYGERLGEEQNLKSLYHQLGDLLRNRFNGWRAAIFTCNRRLLQATGLPIRQNHPLFNGAMECKLSIHSARQPAAHVSAEPLLSAGARMLVNRLRKNLRHRQRWARRTGITCYRLYDSDLPEYAMAIDIYKGTQCWAHVQEYEAPASVAPTRARLRREEALTAVSEVLDIPPQQVFPKMRRRQRGREQYRLLAHEGRFYEVREGTCRLLVNFTDRLDTGLFLDQRLTREMLRETARGRHFLNLFGYTGTATVHAAMGGAATTTTVDMSATYLEWARRNLALNGFSTERHRLVQANCLSWLTEAAIRHAGGFGLVFLDPPTFSNSKRMDRSFDVQRDHAWLISRASQLLAPNGVLVFSTNRRGFKMHTEALSGLEIEDVTRATIPPDFARDPKVHRCWRIRVVGNRKGVGQR